MINTIIIHKATTTITTIIIMMLTQMAIITITIETEKAITIQIKTKALTII